MGRYDRSSTCRHSRHQFGTCTLFHCHHAQSSLTVAYKRLHSSWHGHRSQPWPVAAGNGSDAVKEPVPRYGTARDRRGIAFLTFKTACFARSQRRLWRTKSPLHSPLNTNAMQQIGWQIYRGLPCSLRTQNTTCDDINISTLVRQGINTVLGRRILPKKNKILRSFLIFFAPEFVELTFLLKI